MENTQCDEPIVEKETTRRPGKEPQGAQTQTNQGRGPTERNSERSDPEEEIPKRREVRRVHRGMKSWNRLWLWPEQPRTIHHLYKRNNLRNDREGGPVVREPEGHKDLTLENRNQTIPLTPGTTARKNKRHSY
uniref:Uncharacterized protein n=1 Tax=Cannabis sativa TaxID=3483 RepID=A0A803PBY0_CANSA